LERKNAVHWQVARQPELPRLRPAVNIPTARRIAAAFTLCGRDSVQIHERRRSLDLAALAEKLSVAGVAVRKNDFLLNIRCPHVRDDRL